MSDSLALLDRSQKRPALPTPTRQRWQPLRMGLVELYHYDSEEFWFRDGHLLLRGNNGTGKSKVLSLTLPFLLDAQVRASRLEPDGDSSKKVAWNLLMNNSYDRRIGYAWIEFGRFGEDGRPHYISLGAGLSAKAARRQVESWFFMLDDVDDAPRINRDLWLTSDQRVVLTRERLRETIEGRGQLFETAAQYRRAVDERLFHLGTGRYDALMDTLIQLRQPQLSKKPDESALSNALTEALPPLAPELLSDVAESLGQLEEDRRQLEEYRALSEAVNDFEQRYRAYAGTLSRRQARILRQAQTDFDNASRARSDAQVRYRNARDEEARAQTESDDAEVKLAEARTQLDTLRANPTMQDANRLEAAKQDADQRRRAMRDAAEALEQVRGRLERSTEESRQAEERSSRAERMIADLRGQVAAHADRAGLRASHDMNPLSVLDSEALAGKSVSDFEGARASLRALVVERREQIRLLDSRRAEVTRAEDRHGQCREIQAERRDEAETASGRRTQADADVDQKGRALVESWERHFESLQQLDVGAEEGAATLASLAEWVVDMEDDNPAARALQAAQLRTSQRLAERGAVLADQRGALEEERQSLEEERRRLDAGFDAAPPAPYTRAPQIRDGREGAPFWQLVDFRDHVATPQRAGLEAALEAAGLLDAWVSPDGRLQTGEGGRLLHDTQLLARQRQPSSLADWLKAAVPAECRVSAGTVERILTGIACADEDPAESEAWVAADGRYRLADLAGAWTKPAAVHIGHAARMAARLRRKAEITERLAQIAEDRASVEAKAEDLARDRKQASEEWRSAPTDEVLRNAHISAAACAREAQHARQRLAEADDRTEEAGVALKAARERFSADAADMRLPESPDALLAVESALEQYRDALDRLVHAIGEVRLAVPELQRQRAREDEARGDLRKCEERFAGARSEAAEASARHEVLRDTVGAKVDDLQRRLADAQSAVERCEASRKSSNEALRKAGEGRAVAEQRAETAGTLLQQCAEARERAVAGLQQYAGTGLLSAALPHLELPDMGVPWTIDPALTLARRAEQELGGLKDDDETWSRIQRQINVELTELQRALSALGHQAPAETSDWGLIVHIVYQNRTERPDRLATRLAEEIDQRSELLTAKERAVLENHLQAEIAAEIQRLMQGAERQIDAINRELHKRPTSTGVRYRLRWQPLAEADGAPIGLEAARKRLLATSADLWSADDRSVVGTMLQQRITNERERADSAVGGEVGSLHDQLVRALDYRKWHRFRVERWQDGHWRKLSGPASSGERALGLTVPLFAAVASFYNGDNQSGYTLSPRLMLLDEAFAGIDDTARAHCMGLIREFDLDFVITSEREWACYAELPGVAICQLQRREGIDAVFVSRWSWDGRAKSREADPDRRFVPG